MSEEKNGGPAFPCPENADKWGLSLRDFFVANSKLTLIDARNQWHAMNGNGRIQPDLHALFDMLAQMRGMEADSLLAERQVQ